MYESKNDVLKRIEEFKREIGAWSNNTTVLVVTVDFDDIRTDKCLGTKTMTPYEVLDELDYIIQRIECFDEFDCEHYSAVFIKDDKVLLEVNTSLIEELEEA